MSSLAAVKAEKISIIGVRIINAAIDHPSDGLFTDIKGFKTDVAFTTGFNLEDKLARAELLIKVETDSEQTEKGSCRYDIHFIYKIDNLKELVSMTNKGLEVSQSLQNTLASISYSTARGMLINRFQNTVFQDFILPIMNPDQLID